MYRPRRKSLGVGDRVVITKGALRELLAVVVTIDSSDRLTLQPDGWPLGALVRISKKFVQRDWRLTESDR